MFEPRNAPLCPVVLWSVWKENEIYPIRKTFTFWQKKDYLNHFYLPIVLFPAKFYIIPTDIGKQINNFIKKFLDPYKSMNIEILTTVRENGGLLKHVKNLEKFNVSIMLKNYTKSKWRNIYSLNMSHYRIKPNKILISGHIKAA